MHGDREVSTKEPARVIGANSVSPCDPRDAQRYPSNTVGVISPFGAGELPVYVEETILKLPRLFIDSGRRGFLVEMAPSKLLKAVKPITEHVSR